MQKEEYDKTRQGEKDKYSGDIKSKMHKLSQNTEKMMEYEMVLKKIDSKIRVYSEKWNSILDNIDILSESVNLGGISESSFKEFEEFKKDKLY